MNNKDSLAHRIKAYTDLINDIDKKNEIKDSLRKEMDLMLENNIFNYIKSLYIILMENGYTEKGARFLVEDLIKTGATNFLHNLNKEEEENQYRDDSEYDGVVDEN